MKSGAIHRLQASAITRTADLAHRETPHATKRYCIVTEHAEETPLFLIFTNSASFWYCRFSARFVDYSYLFPLVGKASLPFHSIVVARTWRDLARIF